MRTLPEALEHFHKLRSVLEADPAWDVRTHTPTPEEKEIGKEIREILLSMQDAYEAIYLNSLDFLALRVQNYDILEVQPDNIGWTFGYVGRILPKGPDIFAQQYAHTPVGVMRDPETGRTTWRMLA